MRYRQPLISSKQRMLINDTGDDLLAIQEKIVVLYKEGEIHTKQYSQQAIDKLTEAFGWIRLGIERDS